MDESKVPQALPSVVKVLPVLHCCMTDWFRNYSSMTRKGG